MSHKGKLKHKTNNNKPKKNNALQRNKTSKAAMLGSYASSVVNPL